LRQALESKWEAGALGEIQEKKRGEGRRGGNKGWTATLGVRINGKRRKAGLAGTVWIKGEKEDV